MEHSRGTLDVRRGYVHLLFLAGFIALGVRLAVIQVWDHEWLSGKAREMQNATLRLEPQRGMILDREGRALAVTMASSSASLG